jgi:hypothetical protein
MRIKVEPFLMKKGNRVAKAAIEFDEPNTILTGFHLIGFTICDDPERGEFVLFPASIIKNRPSDANAGHSDKPFYFLRPGEGDNQLDELEQAILDVYRSMTGKMSNTPHFKSTNANEK